MTASVEWRGEKERQAAQDVEDAAAERLFGGHQASLP
jgi:hypothetical protein